MIVSFMNEDPRFPVVLGSVYSAKMAAAYPPDEKNTIKGLKTRSKMELTFDDEDKIVTVKTPAGHVFVMDDKEGSIKHHGQQQELDGPRQGGHHHRQRVEDRHQGKGRYLRSRRTGNLSMKATANASCEGMQIDLKAQTTLSAQGNASAELKSSGMTTVQGLARPDQLTPCRLPPGSLICTRARCRPRAYRRYHTSAGPSSGRELRRC